MPLAQLSAGFQSLLLLPTSKLGPSGADSQVGGFVYVLEPCDLSNELSCEVGGSIATTTPTSFYSQRFWGFLFLHWNPGFYGLSLSPVVPPSLSTLECGINIHCLAPMGPQAILPCILSAPAAHLCPSYQSG